MSPSLADVRVSMTRYGMSTFLVLGVIGNLINVLMFARRESLRNSCSLYLLTASIINILSILWGIIPSLYILDHTDPSTYSVVYCKLRLYTIHTILMIGRSLMVVACFDRYALCSHSNRLRLFCQTKIAIRVSLAHLIIWPLVTIHIPFLQQYIQNRCYMPGINDIIYASYSTVVAGILPPVLMSIFSILTMRHRRELLTRLNAAGVNTKRDNAFMTMLVSQVIIYVITTGMYPAMTLYLSIIDGRAKSIGQQQIETFLNFIAGSFLIYLNPASTFFIYFLAAKTFRRDCKDTFIKQFRRLSGQRTRIEPRIAHTQNIMYVHQNTRV
ncbi:unnamed protein product [Adineta ricciae]|uniref:G-protein coupled receptors family 1 profile domain-containing protein n=1 Tax=Adineta ricciae TaxID=249248 RepID=A0A815MK01_ADIRI|nr:unnamed protein product [Adineta ricciae]